MFASKFKMTVDIRPGPLVAKMKKESVRALFRLGGKTRTAIRRMIRRTKKAKSKEGEPPRSHVASNEFGLKTVVFKVDKEALTMRAGPVVRGDDVPGTLEKGGMVTTRARNGKIYRFRMGRRPWTSRALDQIKMKYPEEWRNAIK